MSIQPDTADGLRRISPGVPSQPDLSELSQACSLPTRPRWYETRRVPGRWGLSAGLLLMFFLVGCSGGGNQPAPQADNDEDDMPAVVINPDPEARPAPRPGGGGAADAPRPREQAADTPAPTPSGTPRRGRTAVSADSPDAFWAWAEHPNFTLLDEIEQQDQQQKLLATDTFQFQQPKIDEDSSHFHIESRPETTVGSRDPQKMLPAHFTELPQYGYDPSGWPLRIQSSVDESVMVFIPAGVFTRGKDGADPHVGPEHSVYQGPYYIDLHEVTLQQFNAWRDSVTKSGGRPAAAPQNSQGNPQEPALGMLWRDAVAYLEYVHKELPTEAEWEKAARGPRGFDHPWGFGRPAWHQARQPGQISPVMQYPTDTSPFGVMDMAGNAREWCQDWYIPDAYSQAVKEGGEIPRNPAGPRRSGPQSLRVIRGNGSDWTLWHRSSGSLSDRLPDVGFRGVLRLPDEPS